MSLYNLLRSSSFQIGFPLLLAIQLCLSQEQVFSLLASYQELVNVIPYILFALVILLSQPFNQGTTGLVSLLMLVSYYMIHNWLKVPLDDINKIIFVLLATLLPLNLLLIHALPDKRILSRFGVTFSLFILLQLVWVSILLQHLSAIDISWLWQSFLKPLPTLSPSPLMLIILSFFITAFSALILLCREQSSDQIIFITLLFTSVMLFSFNKPLMPALTSSITAILLLISIINSSHELAFIDQLTELPGRRSLEVEIKHLSGLYTIAMVDIDHFKHFNDTYGHRTGDEVLRLVAQLMSKNKGRGKIFRYGGEEFTILFKGRNANQCMPYLNNLRTRVAEYDLKLRDYSLRKVKGIQLKGQTETVSAESVNITVSIGVADSISESIPENVMKAADKALYRAKNGGRNRVTNLRFA
ncbi:GGDEF domain-containing protein [Shewanella atlantica]|uniref:GGDEF domain-containing protein n=1 Tax=Shewanella atlantica TaxID=271099 RepID=UPI003736B4AE